MIPPPLPPAQSPARPTLTEEPTSPATPTLSSCSVAEHLQHLELLLDLVLAMVVILNTTTTTPVYSVHMRDAVKALSTLFRPEASVDTPNLPSAQSSHHRYASHMQWLQHLPPAKPTLAHAPLAAPASKQHRVTSPPHHSHSAHHPILRWPTVETPPPETFVPTHFVEDLNDRLSKSPIMLRKIASANLTRSEIGRAHV